MEYQKIIKLLGTMPDEVPRFITKNWIEVHDQSGNTEDRHKPSKQIRLKTSMLRSDLCDFSDPYIVAKGTVALTKTNGRWIIDIRIRLLPPFTNCILKINNVLIDNAEDLDVVMPMYNVLEYSKNFRKTTESLWNYYSDKPNNPPAAVYNAGPITNPESFKYKSSITGKTSNANQ